MAFKANESGKPDEKNWTLTVDIDNAECIIGPEVSTQVWGKACKQMKDMSRRIIARGGNEGIYVTVGVSTMEAFIDRMLVNSFLDKWLESTSMNNICLQIVCCLQEIDSLTSSIVSTDVFLKDEKNIKIIYQSVNKFICKQLGSSQKCSVT